MPRYLRSKDHRAAQREGWHSRWGTKDEIGGHRWRQNFEICNFKATHARELSADRSSIIPISGVGCLSARLDVRAIAALASMPDAGSIRLKERRNKREKTKPRFPRTTVLGTVRLKYGREFLCFYAEGEHVRRLRGITYGRTSIMRVSDFELTTRRPT